MTSLDDSIISTHNLRILDNASNYNREALDFFHYKFTPLEISKTYNFMSKLDNKNCNSNTLLLRLPNCDDTDSIDYINYFKRLNYCMIRRYNKEFLNFNNNKNLTINPLNINWNKENDITTLYGPNLISKDYFFHTTFKNNTSRPRSSKSISFTNDVKQRNIDRYGQCFDSYTIINDFDINNETDSDEDDDYEFDYENEDDELAYDEYIYNIHHPIINTEDDNLSSDIDIDMDIDIVVHDEDDLDTDMTSIDDYSDDIIKNNNNIPTSHFTQDDHSFYYQQSSVA